MDKLNAKVQTTQDETKFEAQNVGLYGYDSTATKWRRLACDTEGKLNIEATLELDSSTLAKEAKQDDIINATNRAINNTGAIGDGSVNATSISLGYDRTGGQGRAILVDSGGKVETNTSINVGHGLATEAKQDDIINATNRAINNTGSIGDGSTNATMVALGYDRSGGQGRSVLVNGNGELMVNLGSSTTQNVNCLGNEEGDGTGAVKHLHLDGNGNVFVKEVGTVNVAPSNDTNGHITDDPANSVAVALTGRQTIGTATTQTFLKCDATGALLTSGGGGGSSASNQYNNGGSEETLSVIAPTGPATSLVTPAVTILDMTNYKGLQVNITTSSASYFDISVAVEFSNSATFLTTLGAAYSDIQTFNQAIDVSSNPISGQYVANILMTPEYNSQQPQAKYARATFNHNNNAGSNISVVINTIQMPF